MIEFLKENKMFDDTLEWRNIGPFRGGRVVAVAGDPINQNNFYMSRKYICRDRGNWSFSAWSSYYTIYDFSSSLLYKIFR